MAERITGAPTIGRDKALAVLAGLGLLAAGVRGARAQTYGPDQTAAARGTDDYTLNGGNWDIGFEGTSRFEHLKPDPSGAHHLVRLGPGTIAELYMDIHQLPGENVTFLDGPVRPVTLVVNSDGVPPSYLNPDGTQVPAVYMRGGTLRKGISIDQLFEDVKRKERAEQVGVAVLKVGSSLVKCPPLGPVPDIRADRAPFWYGGDTFSQWEDHPGAPSHWKNVDEGPGVTTIGLETRPDGHHSRLRWQEGLRGLYGLNIELWWEVIGPDGQTRIAIPGFADGTGLPDWGIDGRGFTIRNHREPGYPANRREVIPKEYWSYVAAEQAAQQRMPLPIGFNPYRADLICVVDP